MKQYIQIPNSGEKIKLVAQILSALMCLFYLVIFFKILDFDEDLWFEAIMISAVGIIITDLMMLFMFAFGDLVDSNMKILAHLSGNSQNVSYQNVSYQGANPVVQRQPITPSDRLAKLEKQYSSGIISQEEYAIQKAQLTGEM